MAVHLVKPVYKKPPLTGDKGGGLNRQVDSIQVSIERRNMNATDPGPAQNKGY